MTLKKLRTRGRIIAAAAVGCTLALAIPASVAIPATAAHAATACTAVYDNGNWDVPYGDGCNNVIIPGSHECTTVIANGVDESDECADIVAANDFADGAVVWGQGEFYCQGRDTQCAGLNVTVDMSWTWDDGFEAATTAPARFKCNPNPGPACVTSGRNYVRTTRSDDITGADNPCVHARSWDPYDGWHGTSQVLANKFAGAFHMPVEWDSGNVNVCFEAPHS